MNNTAMEVSMGKMTRIEHTASKAFEEGERK
jgi:hypothetical protein